MSTTKRVQVTFSAKQWRLLERLRGEMGDGDADIVRTITMAWLAEKSLVSTTVKQRMSREDDRRGNK